MKTNDHHTATPWILFYDGGKPKAILPAGKPGSVCEFSYVTRANAAFIVKAVNSHDGLLEALKGLMPLLDGDGNCLEFYEDEILAAEAALAKAEGGSK